MTFKDVAAVSGKPGLYKIIKPSRTGVILESLDAEKKRILAGANQRISVLQEVSVYTNDEEGTISLENVFKKINELFGMDLNIHAKSDGHQLADFMASIVPMYDREKVYSSDIKKLISWYGIISKLLPELIRKEAILEQEKPEKKAKSTKSKVASGDEKKSSKKPAAKKKQ